MKKALLSLAVIAASGSYVVYENHAPQQPIQQGAAASPAVLPQALKAAGTQGFDAAGFGRGSACRASHGVCHQHALACAGSGGTPVRSACCRFAPGGGKFRS
jgi:hypothetical protein